MSRVGKRAWGAAACVAMACVAMACGHDWDAFDPRLTGAGASVSSGAGGGASSSSTGGGMGGMSSSVGTGGAGTGGSGTAPCDPPAIEDPASGHCYQTIAANAEWDAQRAQCQALGTGWDLAALSSETELEFVDDNVPYTGGPWIGGRDVLLNDVFVWVNGEPWGFTPWESGDPNGGDEDCVELIRPMSSTEGLFRDNPCDELHPALCERP